MKLVARTIGGGKTTYLAEWLWRDSDRRYIIVSNSQHKGLYFEHFKKIMDKLNIELSEENLKYAHKLMEIHVIVIHDYENFITGAANKLALEIAIDDLDMVLFQIFKNQVDIATITSINLV